MRLRFPAAAVGVLVCYFFLDIAMGVLLSEKRDRAEVLRRRTAEEWIRELQVVGDPTRRLRATDALWQFGENVVPDVARCLHHPARQVRESACLALSRMGPTAQAAVPDLIELVGEPTEPARLEAIRTLSRIGPVATLSVEVLSEATRDTDPTIRQSAFHALGQLGASAAPALCSLLQDDDLRVRMYAVKALAWADADPTTICDALEPLAASDNADLREAVFVAFSAQGPRAVNNLKRLLRNDNPAIRRQAALTLCKLGASALAAAPTLVAALNDTDVSVRFWALRALAELELPDVADRTRIIAALDDPEPDIRWQAANTLARTRESGFVVHHRSDRMNQ
ncbi:MAG TPA: HEAT repeat domain-containing protein [Pirellulaceae bacterium]|jgi:HEAT repeat protein|nr:HEAT repeat domain-containing protein [Pirellulaceae bacterium]